MSTDINIDNVEVVTTHPGQPVIDPTPEERLAALEAEIRGMKERAAVEAAKSAPTAKGVAQAVAQDTP